MLHTLETHGIEVLITYYLVIAVLGTLPPLPPSATYMQRWLFAIAHAICGNARSVMAAMNMQPPLTADEKEKSTSAGN